MGPTNNLIYLLQHVTTVVTKQVDDALQQLAGITLSQYKILTVLEWDPKVQQKKIATTLGQTEASVSRQIKLLEKKGLVSVKADPQNRRKHFTTPTVSGMRATEAATTVMRRSYGTTFAGLPADQTVFLSDYLQKLHKHVRKPGVCDHN
ncbi:MAG: MarR family winged helix-turn-helix transcriptional regulator [Patescibacteria group bacterium]|nr:MarR family winged helix-turn-helix transcriptional regulator [Patescibacteria group bacterium]